MSVEVQRPAGGAASEEARSRRRAGARRRALAPIALVLAGLACATVIQSFSWNQTSHYDLIRALDRGAATIDAYQQNTGDKAFYRGHWFSARAPGLALYSLPWYGALREMGAESWALESPAQRNDDEMVYLIGLWGSVLPGLALMLLAWRVGEREERGYGVAAALAIGLGTMALPLSTLLFSHIFTAFLGFAAFALALSERDGPPRPALLALAGLAVGYAIGAEYPLAFVAVVVGAYALWRPDARTPGALAVRALAYAGGAAVGLVPLALYNHYAFHSFTHLAYANIARQKAGFFGIGLPSLRVLATLLLDSRGLLVISPVLALAIPGLVVMYRRGRRAEALAVAAICLCYLLYNSGYYLPFGGAFMGPRFLATMLPFLAAPLAVAFGRFPGPAVALAGASVLCVAAATITHPLVGYETETVIWWRYLREGFFQPTIGSAYGLGRGWGGMWPFLVALTGAIACGAWATARMALGPRQLGLGVAALAAWGLFAALGPTLLGLDHQGLLDIARAGDITALHQRFGSYPLQGLAPVACGAGLVALLAARLLRHRRAAPAAAAKPALA